MPTYEDSNVIRSNKIISDYGHKWSNNSDHTRVECQYCGDSYNSKWWCTNRLVVSEQDRDMDEQMSKYYES